MFRLRNSWAIAKASGRVLKADKELVVLPLLGGILTILVAALLGGVAWLTVDQVTDPATQVTEYNPTPVTYAVGVVGYVLLTFCGLFFTSALVAGAYERLTGGNPSLGSSLGAAGRRVGSIFLWSLVVSTVGLILNAIEERAGFVGAIIANTLAFAWKVVTWLAVPIIIVEGTGPFASLKRSGQLFKKTWGENLVAQIGFGLLGFLFIFPGVVVGGAITVAAPIVGIPLVVLYIVAVSLVLASLNGVYRAALYIYASTGQVPEGYAPEQLTSAFRPKSGMLR